jgi:hypothetical protein
MEALVLGFIALNSMKRQQERIVPEPAQFQSFDLRTLGHSYDAGDKSPNRAPDRKRSYVAHTVS